MMLKYLCHQHHEPVRGTSMSRKSKKEVLNLDDVIADFDALLEANKRGINPLGKTLPSGRLLHNPAKRTVKSASRWASQQVDNAVKAADDWLDGVKNPSRDPVAAAIDSAAKWEDKMSTAIKEGRFVKGLKKVPTGEVAAIATAVGSGAFSTGITARKSKIDRVVGELQTLAQSASDTIQAMPDKTDADREKRLLSARKLMIEVGKRRRG